MATLDDVVVEMKQVGKSAVDAMQSGTVRKIADLIDEVNKISDEVQAEKAKIDALIVPATTDAPSIVPVT
jgi:uncharacterized protein YoxC